MTVMTDQPRSPTPYLVLADGDNIAVALQPLEAGQTLAIGDGGFTLKDPIAPGHKFALRDIAKGETVLKYTVSIGRSTRAIMAGESVHTHNLASDYLPTYTLDGVNAPEKGA